MQLVSEMYISWNGPSSTSFACHGLHTMITDRSRETRVIYQMDNKLNCLYSDMQLYTHVYDRAASGIALRQPEHHYVELCTVLELLLKVGLGL